LRYAVWRWRPGQWPPWARIARWLWGGSFLALWVVTLFQMIANYAQDPYNPLLRGTAAYGHNEENALLRGIILGLLQLVWLYGVVRPWSFRLASLWSAGRLVIALALLVPWTVYWGAAGIHGGGVTRINARWLLGVDLILMCALVGSLLACASRWVRGGAPHPR
jgi:hypothetical protein